MGRGTRGTRGLLASALLASLMLASAASASASMTIGQLAPAASPSVSCVGAQFDHFQPTVTSGNAYVVPALPPATELVISSWSHNAANPAGASLTMKVYRQVIGPTHRVVGLDGPRQLTPSTVNTFPSNVPVEPGDLLGFHTPVSPGTACIFTGTGDTHQVRGGNLGLGEPGDFSTTSNRLNITAVVSPANTFTLGKLVRKANGTAKLTVDVPNPGELVLSGGGIKKAGGARVAKTVAAGPVTLTIRAKGKKRQRLNESGKVKVKTTLTYTPSGGETSTQTRKVKLRQG
jgi:hypothetical protein